MAAVLSNIALVYNSLGDYENALKYNFNSLKIRTSINDSIGVAFSYNNIGTTYHYKSNYSQALEYYLKALKLKQTLHDKEGMASTYNNIGQLFVEMYSDSLEWPLDSALEYFLKAYYTWSSTSNKSGLSEVLPNIGNVYSLKNLNDRAFDAYLAAMNVQKQANDSAGLALTYYNIGIVYYNQHNFKLAKSYFNNSVIISRQHLISDLVKDNLKMLFLLDGNNGEYKQAYNHAYEFVKINDSLVELSKNRLIEDYSSKSEFQAYENKKLQNVMLKSRMWIIILSISSLLLFISIIITILKKRKSNKKL
jgi:tetratricopeptide (TPR) repeat protein